MRVAYFDCFSGISGDMTIGALLDAGLSFEDLRAQLALLHVQGYEISVKGLEAWLRWHEVSCTPGRGRATSSWFARYRSDHPRQCALDATVQERTLAVFTRLAEAEAAVHQSTVDHVHFHEVGAIDAIVDITGAVIGLHLLGIQRVLASPINTGSGFVRAAHGMLPVPAPGTAELLKGIPTYARGRDGELTTPTCAALMATLVESFGTLPLLRIDRIGYGAGTGRRSCQTLRICCGCSSVRTSHQNRPITAHMTIMRHCELLPDILRMAYLHNGSLDTAESGPGLRSPTVAETSAMGSHVRLEIMYDQSA